MTRLTSDPFVPHVGGVVSADIAVPDHDRETRFYSRVLTTGDAPLWRDDLMNNLGLPIIGLGERTAEYDSLPLQWMPHIQVADVATSATRAVELGGRELMHGKDDEGASQWAVLLDPDGAAFGIIPVVPLDAMPSAGDAAGPMGRIAGLELAVADAGAARDFYRQVVGWSVQDVEVEDGSARYVDHAMVGDGGRPMAAVCHARGASQDLPPVWLIHLPVGDLEESVRGVRELGGEIVAETAGDEDGRGRVVVRDPVGAYLALVPA